MSNELNEEFPSKSNNTIEKDNTTNDNNNYTENNQRLNYNFQNLITILNLMSIEFPLSDLAEKIESETGGIFTFKQLYKIINKYYKKLSKKDKKNLIRYLPLTPLDVSIEKPYITVFSLFSYFSSLLNIKIFSPSLIMYDISNRIKNFYKKSTLEFFISNDYEASGEINLDELYFLFYKQLKIEENIINIFYDMINYENKNKIKIEKIILTIDSFRDDNNSDLLNEKDKNILFLNVILDKAFINIDKIFQKEKNEYMKYSDLKKIIKKEISKNNKYLNYNEYINENLLDSIFNLIINDDKIYYNDQKNAFLESISKLSSKKMKLTATQKYWINKYIDKLLSNSIEPKSLIKEENNAIDLKDIQNFLVKLNINIDDINNIINALDLNHTGIIDNSHYESIINIIIKEKESIIKLNCPIIQNDEDRKKEINNLWDCGIRPNYYYLLPLKGNEKILSKLNKDIKNKKIKKFTYKNTISKSNIFTKKSETENDNIYKHDYNDEYFLKITLENFNFDRNKFPCFNLLNYLLENDFSNKYCSNIIKLLDNDGDGYIDIIDLIKFLLHELKYKATKLVFKYLYIRIYKELNLNSSKEFFTMYNFGLKSIIDNEKFIKLMKDLNIDFPLTKEILNEINIIYDQPLIYEYISDQIDFYKNDKYINNIQNTSNLKENIIYNTKKFEQEMVENSQKNDFNKIIDKCPEKMNYLQYLKTFANPLGFNEFFSLIIFQLLKTFTKKGEQIISKNDLIIFFDSYTFNKKEKKPKKKEIKEILNNIQKIGAPIKYAFEIIPFRKNGLIPTSELIKYLNKFYGDNLPKSDLIDIVFFIDNKKNEIINYEQIQKFLNQYCKIFSELLELQIIACNINKYNFINSESYFNQRKIKNIIKNEKMINKDEHNIILNDICSNDSNKENLFIYLANNGKNYNLEKLIDLLNYYFEKDIDIKYNKINKEDENIENENLIPNKLMVENILKEIKLGVNGNISLNEFIMKFKKIYRKALLFKIDLDKKGYLTFPEFINQMIKIYGTDIDLNYKLCAQYFFLKFIKNPIKVREYILNKTNASFIETYITHKNAYNNFKFAFCNNKILFETFYLIYKEKKGKHIGMLNLINLEQFILVNNDLLFQNDGEISNNKNNNIRDILSKKKLKIKDIINHINISQSGLNKNFTIKENYMKTLLEIKLGFIERDIEIICQKFNVEDEKFDLKKLFLYENEDIKKYDNILSKEILPKIRKNIIKSKVYSYKEYKLKYFNNIDYLDINELFSKFNNLYNLSLYDCLLLMKNEQYFSTEKFFTENNLKSEFKEKDIEPALKLALIRLNEFFKKNTDKIKVFKEFDLDRNGKISSDEFIIALNSFENLELNDNQKYKILNLIDINKDGQIDINEFIKFINNLKNNINDEGEFNLNVITQKKKIDLNLSNINSELNQSNIITDRSMIQNNINYNKNILKQNNDTFLNYVIILQEGLLEKNNNDNIQNDFIKEDPMNNGIISQKKFKDILKKNLFNIKKENFNDFINLANKGMKDEINKENEGGKINYQNFLKNLANFKYNKNKKNKNLKQSDNEEIILPKIN